MNADGYADLVVTSSVPLEAYVFASSGAPVASGGPSGAQTVLKGSGGVDGGFGSAAAVGDLNADGYADVLVCDQNDGAVYVFGSAGGSPIASGDIETASTVLTGTSGFGMSVAP